ncbi:MAG: hypothetical protein AAFS04_10445 [Cyanobacteria bacterium J06631_9]
MPTRLFTVPLAMIASSFFGAVAEAQINNESHSTCRSASNTFISELEAGRDLDVVRLGRHGPNEQSPYEGRTQDYVFTATGSAVTSVLASPVFMAAKADQFLSDCGDAATVIFGLEHTGHFAVMGEVNGATKRFQCAEDIGIEPRRGRELPVIPWGYALCSL